MVRAHLPTELNPSPIDPAGVSAALTRITRAIGAGRELAAVFETAADELAPLVPYDRCSVALLDAERRRLRVSSVRTRLPSVVDDGDRPVAGTAAGWAIDRRRPVIHDVGPTDRFVGDEQRRRAGLKQVVVVPLLVDDGPVGAFALSSTRSGVYRTADLWVLETVADHLGLAIAANQLRREAERRATRAQFLTATAAVFASSLDLDRTLRVAARRACEVLGDLNAIFLIEEATGEPRLCELAHPNPATEALVRELVRAGPPNRSGAVIGPPAGGQSVLIPALSPDQVSPEMRGVVERLGVSSVLAVPLRAGGELVGVLASARTERDPNRTEERRPLTADDLALAEDLGTQIGVAILNARLHTATRRALDESEALRRIGRELVATLDVDRVVRLVSSFTQLLLGTDYAAAAVRQEDGTHPLIGMVGNRSDAHLTSRFRAGHGIVGRAVASPQPVVIEGFPDNPAFPPDEFPILRAEGLRSAFAIPFIAGDRVFGALVAGFRAPRPISAEDLRLATALADQAALVLENTRLLTEAQRAVADRDDFLAIAAHELRTPLTTLKGRAQLLQRRLGGGLLPQDAESMRLVLDQIDHLNRLVDDLLDASHLAHGQLPLIPKPVDLIDLVRRVAAEVAVRPDADGAAVPIRVETEEERVDGVWDPWRLEQVLVNLLANARRFSAPGAPVAVRVCREWNEARVEIADRGIGIPPDDLERIFERFYRGAAGVRAGIGLGLAICRQIVADHGGRLWATSPGPGRGATFVMTIPLRSTPSGVGSG